MNERPLFGGDSDGVDRLLAFGLEGPGSVGQPPPAVQDPRGPGSYMANLLEIPGSEIGRYKLLRVLGEGGMGIVYLAEQREPVRRQVALKILKPGMDSQRVLARFEVEQQALALMEHPHIARVYDAGLAPSGRPYFVMEYVKGIPITAHCDQYRLTIEQRLHLFLRICAAVQHAHQKGIIHRDLKPSNILVVIQDQEMVPKVIDFGVARAISQPLTERTLYTEQGQLIGTPEYTSPEQASGGNQDIDTRTDIYSLGVVLYELLAGVLPFDPQTLRTGGLEHIRKVICEEEPKTPSSRVRTTHHFTEGKERCVIRTLPASPEEAAQRRQMDVRTLQRRLHGDLDWITLKALEKDRTRRYATVDALATDIRNHLNHQPVSAAPPGTWYRTKKFARRHRQILAVIVAAVVLLALVLWAIQTHVQAAQERQERILAQVQEQYAKADYNGALEIIKPILDSRYVGPRARLLRATILVEHRYYEEAMPELEKLLDKPAEVAGAAHALLARLIWESSSLGPQDLKEFEEHRKKAQELRPKVAEAYYLQATAALPIHEKLDLLGQALRLDSNHYESRRLRALIYDASRNYKRLSQDALAMTLLRPRDPQGYSLLAVAWKGLGDWQEAIKEYDTAIELTARDDPQYVELNARRCEVLLRIGQYERVVTEAQECLKNAPKATALHAHVFCALTALGRYEEAGALSQRIVKSDYGTRTRFAGACMEYVFDTLAAGRIWHPPDGRPEGPAFFYMLEAEKMYHDLSAKKAHRLITNCFSPCWSPDGTKVAFAAGLPGYSGVAVYDLRSQQTDLLIAPGKDPRWSPDGRHIAFVRDCQALRLSEVTTGSTRQHTAAYYRGEEVWVMNEDGKDPRRLARSAGCPSWSIDSNCVYYPSRADNMLYKISIKDLQAKPVPVLSRSSPWPAVSPDGNYVAEVADGVVQIVDLTTKSCVAEWPTWLGLFGARWSPDGREFSFGGDGGIQDRTGLWIYEVAKREAVKVLKGQIAGGYWSRNRAKLLLRLAPPYYEAWVVDLDPNVSTAEALGPGQTLDEYCKECITTCTRELEFDPNLGHNHWVRARSALWIDHPEASVYLKETDLALGRLVLSPYGLCEEAQRILTHPALRARLLPLAWIEARNAVERQPSYARELAPLFERVGQHEYAAQLLRRATVDIPEGRCRYEKRSDTYTVVGSGADIAGSMDEFRFTSKRLQGDGSIAARIESIENVHEWTKAGVMIRESLDPGAKFAAVYATPGRGVRYQVRPVADRNTVSDSHVATPEQIALRAPIWIKIERKGDQCSAFYSSDGATWTTMVWSPQTVSIPESVYIGLAVTSHDNKRTAEARISHVTTTGNVSPAGPFTESQDIRFQPPSSSGPATSSTATTVAAPKSP